VVGEEILRGRSAARERWLDRGCERTRELQAVEHSHVGRFDVREQVLLGDRVDVRAVELRSEDRELVRREVHVVRVEAEKRLVAKAWTARVVRPARAALAGGRDAIRSPRLGGVARGVDSDVELRARE